MITLNDLIAALPAGRTADRIPRSEWAPQLHLTDTLSNPHTPTVKGLLDKYGPKAQYWYAYSPFGPDSYSIELQFATEHRAAMMQCLAEYEAIPTGFDEDDEDDEGDHQPILTGRPTPKQKARRRKKDRKK